MRNYGVDSNQNWVTITDPNYVYLAATAQALRLNLNESPMYGNYGIPAQQSVASQIAPNAAIIRTQNQYAPYFSSLVITNQQSTPQPTYNISAIFQNGVVVSSVVAS